MATSSPPISITVSTRNNSKLNLLMNPHPSAVGENECDRLPFEAAQLVTRDSSRGGRGGRKQTVRRSAEELPGWANYLFTGSDSNR